MLVLACAAACQGTATPPIHEHELLAHVRFLADDQLEGRGPGTRGDTLARHYIATQLQAAGCEPAGPQGTWNQTVPILGITGGLLVVGVLGARLVARGRAAAAAAAGPAPVVAVDDRYADKLDDELRDNDA